MWGENMLKKKVVSFLLVLSLILMSFVGFSNEANATVKPNLKRVSLVAPTTVSLSWKKVSEAVRYEVYCSEDGGRFEKIKKTKKTYCSLKGLDLGTEYSYKVRAIFRGKRSSFSNSKSVTTGDSAYLLDIAEPYNDTSVTFGTFSVAGENYDHGFHMHGRDTEMFYNLKGKYSKISFVCGMVATSDAYSDYQPEVKIYADGNEISENVCLKWCEMAKEYVFDLNYCNQLKIVVPYEVGLGNIKVYK